ncbi:MULTISPECIES: ABC transporter substrate-binding protein [Peribacillus]|uniref:ABC transporter substrate-binding protein n=1 Tax=Peribacillus TaxID=2675229 RepID=UPI00207AD450|nr:ABC transporter substrate-binding protein [Peribacillus asahii]USK58224.1 ABC transporter substrate-binding protein [Peribacillus asahii]
MKKVKKLASFFLVTALAGSILAGCSSDSKKAASNGEKQDTVLEYQVQAGRVSFPELAADLGYLGDLELENVSSYTGGPESIQLTATGETDFGYAFNGAIIKSYAKNVKIKSVVGAYGSDKTTFVGAYALEGSPIKSAKDFIGKKVGMNILGAHFEFVLKDYLRQGGLTEDEIKQVTPVVIPMVNSEQALRSKQVDVVLVNSLPKDLLIERGGVVEIFKDTDVYNTEFTAGDYFFSQDYIEENPDTVKQFTEGVAKAIEWARTTPREEVTARFEKILAARGEDEMIPSLKYWKSTGIAEEGGLINDAEYDTWIKWLEKNGELKEGQVKAADLYTNEFNPYAK